MTAEEILDQAAVNSPVKSFLINDGNVRNIALSAMNEFAEIRSAEFNKWRFKNDWSLTYVNPKGEIFYENLNSKKISHSELYKEFIKAL